MQALPLRFRQSLTSLAATLAFYSRLPVSRIIGGAVELRGFDLARDVALVPVAGVVIGLCGALVLVLARGAGLAPSLAALAATAALVLASGGLHEDGLADVADGFGGGRDRQAKLAIMKDSRLGTFGALALGLVLAARVMMLAELTARSGAQAALVLVAAAGVSRLAGLVPVILLKPARADGLGAGLSRPAPEGLRLASALGVVAVLLPLLAGARPGAGLAGLVLALAGAYGMTRLAARHIGGQTGDVAGAAQQLAETAFLLAFVARP
ncbi:MAG: adenosylcobinamide-GDP ribazoletransferase [Hyphomicrobiales bacterium]|nr:adenosylcobinamide-GDP ribazoletransferase [Hyphomicrobiales bacterium]